MNPFQPLFVRELRPLLPQGVLHLLRSGLQTKSRQTHAGSRGQEEGRGVGGAEAPPPRATGGHRCVPHRPGGEGREAGVPPGCKGTGSLTRARTRLHASWPRPCPCSPPLGRGLLSCSVPSRPGAAPPLATAMCPLPPPLGRTLTSGRTLRYTFFSWVYHSCWGVLGFSGMSDFLAFWIKSG